MTRAHYIVRLSKRTLIPGRSLAFRRGEEDPASVREIRVEDEDEAHQLARTMPCGGLSTVFKVQRNGRRDVISSGFDNNGFASPEERERLNVDGILSLVEQIARMQTEEETGNGMASEDAIDTVNRLIHEARRLTGKSLTQSA